MTNNWYDALDDEDDGGIEDNVCVPLRSLRFVGWFARDGPVMYRGSPTMWHANWKCKNIKKVVK